MHFKNPEILYFLFALIVPVLVHLFQLRRFKKEYFTNVQFLKALTIQTRKSSKVKKWLLLTSRLFLLTCIIFAFAQPFFESEESKNANNELYIILDNSFSMQAKGKKGELLKRAVQDLLEETPENLNFSLLTNTESYWNTDIKSIRGELQNIQYSATAFKLDNIIAKLEAHKTPFKKDIVVITDGIGINSKQLQDNDKLDAPIFIVPKAVKNNNISIDSVFIQKTLDQFYEISVQLSNYGEDFDPKPISLYNNNALIAKTTITLDTRKKSINFTIPKQAFHGYVTIDDNGLNYDNVLYFSISKAQKTNVIAIGDLAKNTFLSRIYTSEEFNFNSYTLSTLDYNKLEEQDAIVLNELDEIPQALITTLKSFVEKGGNLIVIPSAICSVSNLNTLIANFGKIKFNSLENIEKLITKINFSHPVYNSVFEKKVINFQYPKTKKSFSLSSSYPAVLSYEDQSNFLTSTNNPLGKVAIFAAPINIENSNFQQSPLIVPTFYKIATYNQNNGVNALFIGNNDPYFTEASLSKDAILTIKNKEEQFIPVQQILNNKVKMTFGDYPQQAGNFTIFNKKELIENISFNYARTESNLASANGNIRSNYKTFVSIKSLFDTLQTDRTDNQIWKWFVIFALLFVLTEMAIIRFIK
ncbi:N-terminal double-transmembrane domain-containing protein [Flavobacterium segetis]|uniref:N-terminal double-transmembrane domain-containing protein n=1 Tax=Flavobacterium segetis TaxID=271157 RepID=A0A1M5HJB3_9FLAO|nr:BatA and WFA domain-containing protein [Flavobacterium segetis]SHG16063.1 N-terminal double-transmembrane domain-containing protein [Flavobacterium segetis]